MAAKRSYQQNPFDPRVRELAEFDAGQLAPQEEPPPDIGAIAAPVAKPSNPYVGATPKEKPDADIIALWTQKPEARKDLEAEYDFSAIKPKPQPSTSALRQMLGATNGKQTSSGDFAMDMASGMDAGKLTDFAGRVIGVAPSLLTTAAMHAFSPKEDLKPGQTGPHQRQITADDYLKSLRGEHPSDVESFAEARGASPNVAKGLDFASSLMDPALVSPMRKIASGVTSKLGTGIEDAGRGIYRSVWPKVRQAMEEWKQFESPDISPNIMADVGERLGLKGSWEKMLKQSRAATKSLSENVVEPVIEKLKGFDPGLALVKAKREFKDRYGGVPDYQEPLGYAEEVFNRDIKIPGEIPAAEIHKRKKAANRIAGGSERNNRNVHKAGAATDLEQEALRKKGQVYRNELERETAAQFPDEAGKFAEANQSMSALFGARKAMKRLAKAEAGKNAATQVKGALLGSIPLATNMLGGGVRGLVAAAAPLAGMTAAQIINSPVTRTHAGLGLIKGGKLLQQVPSTAWERLGRLGIDLNPIKEK